ncbi:MAG: DUF4236 domain-containing protein [Methanoregula sp.]|nr:DUF4236 domain-containing protein [Methanoregula sp.]
MRFQKRISLGTGLRLNLSKSGMGLSLGVPGLSTSIGPRGPYLNMGIPGMGLSTRIPLSPSRNIKPTLTYDLSKVSIEMDDEGNIFVSDENGQPLDESLLRKLKRTESYKETLKSHNQELFYRIEREKDKFINIYKRTPPFFCKNDWLAELHRIESELVNRKKYLDIRPSEEKCREELLKIATEKIHSIFFWTNAKKREEYVNQNFSIYYADKLSDYESKKVNFEREEAEKIEGLLKRKQEITENILPGDPQFILDSISGLLQNLSLPIDFSIDYQLSSEKTLNIDIDLPEIEDLPTTKATILKSGKTSVKNKTQTELNQEYATCVCGLAFYFSGNFFAISPTISMIEISGYTQRIDKKTDRLQDDYIYSIKIDRKTIEQLNFHIIDPFDAFQHFEHQLSLKTNFEMKTITPF